uniref:Palmitoyltransferase n=1 Tax=Trichuris muris TaxID=70415 RepID=A0A5S6Q7Y2_TRIMR
MGELHSFKKYLMLKCSFLVYLFGVCYCLFVVVLLTGTNVFHICEKLYGRGNFKKTTIFAAMVVLEVIVNLAMFTWRSKYNRLDYLVNWTKLGCSAPTYSNDSDATTDSDSDPNSDADFPTKYCAHCKFRVPLICHHCPLCNYCVFKKDHHCFFLGGCIGFGNQRHFIVFLFWSMLGSAYALLLAIRFVTVIYKSKLMFGWTRYILPVYILVIIYEHECPKDELLCTLYVTVVMCATFASAWFFFYQWLMVCRGESTMGFFHLKDLFPDNGNPSVSQRIQQVFGPYWVLNFLVPLPYRNQLNQSYARSMENYYSMLVSRRQEVPTNLKLH